MFVLKFGESFFIAKLGESLKVLLLPKQHWNWMGESVVWSP